MAGESIKRIARALTHDHGHHGHGHDHHDHPHDHGHEGHDHGPHGDDHGHAHATLEARPSERRRLTAVIALTATILVAEAVGGILSGSLALLSDAGHMLTDLSAQVISLLALIFAARPPDERRSYGFHRLEILAALLNGLVLMVLAGYLVYQAVRRGIGGAPVDTHVMLPVAAIGLVANGVGLYLLRGARSLNVRSAYLHVLSDTLASLAVIIGGVVMLLVQGAYVIDAILASLIAVLILVSSYRLLRDAVDVLLEAVPRGLDPQRVRADILLLPGVREVHDLHIWTITSGIISMSAHVVVDAEPGSSCEGHDRLIQDVQRLLEKRFEIMHSTLQIESASHQHVSSIH